MDEKMKFIADYLRNEMPFKALCALYGISRKTGYKWVQRYQSLAVEGLQAQSRRPHRSSVTPLWCGKRVLGPKKIQPLLAARFAESLISSQTTIYNILKAAADSYQFIHPFLFDAATHTHAFIQWVERQQVGQSRRFVTF